jgi:hypothetical protein
VSQPKPDGQSLELAQANVVSGTWTRQAPIHSTLHATVSDNRREAVMGRDGTDIESAPAYCQAREAQAKAVTVAPCALLFALLRRLPASAARAP